MTNALCTVVFAFFYPETRGLYHHLSAGTYPVTDSLAGKSLEQIDEIFGDVKPISEGIARVSSQEKDAVETVHVSGAKLGA